MKRQEILQQLKRAFNNQKVLFGDATTGFELELSADFANNPNNFLDITLSWEGIQETMPVLDFLKLAEIDAIELLNGFISKNPLLDAEQFAGKEDWENFKRRCGDLVDVNNKVKDNFKGVVSARVKKGSLHAIFIGFYLNFQFFESFKTQYHFELRVNLLSFLLLVKNKPDKKNEILDFFNYALLPLKISKQYFQLLQEIMKSEEGKELMGECQLLIDKIHRELRQDLGTSGTFKRFVPEKVERSPPPAVLVTKAPTDSQPTGTLAKNDISDNLQKATSAFERLKKLGNLVIDEIIKTEKEIIGALKDVPEEKIPEDLLKEYKQLQLNVGLRDAVSWNKVDEVKELIGKRADPNILDSTGRPLLIDAVGEGMEPLLKELLGAEGILVDATDKGGHWALSIAVLHNLPEIVDMLLVAGADKNKLDSDGNTQLFWAVFNGRDEIVKIFLNHGADLSRKDMYGNPLLVTAAERNHTKIVRMLLEKGANVDEADKLKNTALSTAKSKGYRDIVEVIGEFMEKKKEGGQEESPSPPKLIYDAKEFDALIESKKGVPEGLQKAIVGKTVKIENGDPKMARDFKIMGLKDIPEGG